MKFVLLHEGKNDDAIKSFFMDVWELYVKVSFFFFRKKNTIYIFESKKTDKPFFVDDDESFPYGT
jgi:hypothetical protein